MRFARPLAALALLGLAAAATSACSKDRVGFVVISVDSDMSAPTDLSALSIGVYDAKGVTLLSPPQVFLDDRANYQLKFPATLTVALDNSTQDDGGSRDVRVVVIGYSGQLQSAKTWKASLFRDFRMTVPNGDSRVVHVNLSRLDVGTASGSFATLQDAPKDVALATGPEACTVKEPPVDGVCRAPVDYVGDDAKKLAVYTPEAIYGGGTSATDAKATCWDAPSCFAGAPSLPLITGADGCSVAIPSTLVADRLTVGFLRPTPVGEAGGDLAKSFDDAAKSALCNGSDCYVVLNGPDAEGRDGSGAATIDRANGRVTFPLSVCKMLRGQRTLSNGTAIVNGVVLTDRCVPKTATTPLCAPWALDKHVVTAVGPDGTGGAFPDAGVPADAGSAADAAAEASPDAEAVDAAGD